MMKAQNKDELNKKIQTNNIKALDKINDNKENIERNDVSVIKNSNISNNAKKGISYFI